MVQRNGTTEETRRKKIDYFRHENPVTKKFHENALIYAFFLSFFRNENFEEIYGEV